ncbi:Peptidoglycan glycosyltransferase MrdB [bacterium HR39]|nr:Peptidoglycan glycosyltransferase MrdB [bacterium HR39]
MAGGFAARQWPTLAERIGALNWALLALVLVLGLVGYLVLYSAAGGAHGPWAWRHAARFVLAFLVMLAVALVDIRLVYRLAYPAYAACLTALMAVDAIGAFAKGAQRWLDLGIVRLQPSELAKLALVLALARFYHGLRPEEVRDVRHLAVPLGMIALPFLLVVAQPDLGTALLLAAAGAAVVFLAGAPLWVFVLGAGGLAAAAPVVWSQLLPYQRQRLLTFLDPERDPLGTGYHVIQSKIALGAGGFTGRGFLAGTQAQLDFLPEKHTDFAFAVLAEETGFVGALVLLAIYLALVGVALAVAVRAGSTFGRLVAAGIAVDLFLYVFVNVGMVTGLLPVVGVPLPFVSYGGTAMFAAMLGLGLVLAVDVQRHVPLPRYPSDAPL